MGRGEGPVSFRPAAVYTTLSCFNAAISAVLNPNSASTSLVCWPNSGGRAEPPLLNLT
jgi:hypothetical protein